jgi:hypothetical protein
MIARSKISAPTLTKTWSVSRSLLEAGTSWRISSGSFAGHTRFKFAPLDVMFCGSFVEFNPTS